MTTVTKTEAGQDYPSSAFGYVPDPDEPSTWKLRLWESPTLKVTADQVGRAVAALSPGGYRGQKVEIPADDRAAVKRKVLTAWKSVHDEDDEVPAVLTKALIVKALEEFRKEQPSTSQVHVNAPIGSTADFGGLGAKLTRWKRKQKKTRNGVVRPINVPASTMKATGTPKCKFCDNDATRDTDPPTCSDHKAMEKAAGLVVVKATGSAVGPNQITVIKSASLRYTFSPLYIPNRLDAHKDWADPEDLQKAVWNLQRAGDRTINVQHLPGTRAGEWVELATWPWEHEAELSVPGGTITKHRFPPNTPWMGVVWDPSAWGEVLEGRERGLSIEGTASKIVADLPGLEAA